MNQYLDYIMEQLKNLMAIDSPSGFTEKSDRLSVRGVRTSWLQRKAYR